MLPEARIRSAAERAVQQLIGRPLRRNDRLISSGIIDSLSVLKLIGLLENELSVSLPTEALQPEDFDDVNLIVETVQRVALPL